MIQKSARHYCGFIEKAIKVYINKKDWSLSSSGRGGNKIDLVYYFSGCDITRIGDEYYTNTADTVKIMPPENTLPSTSAVKTTENGMVIDISFYSPESFVDRTTVVDATKNPEIKKLFLNIYKIWVAKKGNYELEAQSLFFRLVNELIIATEMNENREDSAGHIKVAVTYIHENYHRKNFNYEVLPSLCNLKRTRFNQLFKKAFSITPVMYVTKLRLKLAIDMLVDRRYSIAEIADATGFESVSYFSRVFSKHMGITPSKYAEYHN